MPRRPAGVGILPGMDERIRRAVAGTTARPQPWAWALALTVLYAITDELHQGGVAGRDASAGDVGIDAAGALLALAAVRLIRLRRS